MLVLITDIFGRTKYVESLANELSCKVEIIDPYQGKPIDFANESEAYQYFSHQLGVEAYAQRVYERTQQLTAAGVSSMVLLGFSVGASAAWMLNDKSRFSQNRAINASIGFYGSQIRHTAHLKPLVKTSLVFPQAEAHFDVTKLVAELSANNRVATEAAPYHHGFMNPLSVNYHEQAYRTYVDFIKARL